MMSFNPLRSICSALSTVPDARRGSISRHAGWIAGIFCSAAPLAWAVGPASVAPSSVEVRSELVAPSSESRLSAAGNGSATASSAVRSTVWARRGAAAVGVGVESPAGSVSSHQAKLSANERVGLAPSNLLVGVAVNTGPRSSLVMDTPLAYRNTATDTSLNPTEAGREVRVGLVIKPADPLRNLRAGQLFKVELSGRSQVALRPRSGGVAVSYSSRF